MEVINKDNVKILQSKIVTKEEFDYDNMFARPLYSLLSQYDIDRLYNIATSIRYAGNAVKKKDAMLDIMHSRGFIELSAGTNRVCFSYLEDPTICVKVAADRTGIKDNPREFLNQAYLKPFCTKVYEISPCGTVGLFERVRPIQNREEFYSVADQIYELIDILTYKYILADFGTHYFMNYGFREFHDFGPVILDFPYLYEADARKLVCKKPLTNPDGTTCMCGGLIDYDSGFNKLVCTKCGAEYRAVEIAKYLNDSIILQKGKKSMSGVKVSLVKNGKVKRAADTVMKEPTETIKGARKSEVTAKVVKVNAAEANKPAPQAVANVVRPTGNDSGVKVTAHRVPVTHNFKKAKDKKNNFQKKGNPRPDNPVKATAKANKKPVEQPKAEPAKAEEQKTVHVDVDNWTISEYDLEHHIIIFKSGDKVVTLPTDILTEDILETLIPNYEDSKSAAEELQLAKMDVRKLEETIDTLKKENSSLKDKERKSKKNDSLEEEIKALKEQVQEIEDLRKENEKLIDDYEELKGRFDNDEEYIDKANAELEDLRTQVAAYEEAGEVVEEEYEEGEYEEGEEEEYEIGFSRLSGKLSTIGNVAKNTGMETIPEEYNESDHIIVFEDGQGGYYTDQYGNIIIIADINGKSLADSDLKIAPKKKES